MRLLFLSATMLAISTFMSIAAENQIVPERDMVSSCRAAILRGGFPAQADGKARVSRPYVFIGDGLVSSCKFEPNSPPQLTEVFVIPCYECGLGYDDALLSRLNQLLRTHWSPTP